MAEVRLESVRKVFGEDTVAVDDVSMTVEDGELLVVLGPSGCGKSTLLRLLAGLESPSTGRIEFDGRRVDHESPQERNVAMVFQNYALYPHMTVRENLDFPLRMLGRSRKERGERVEEVAGLLGLSSLLDRRPRHLSGGQAQRVAMGRALVREPVLFLLDEPLSNLDAKLRVEMRGVVAEIQQRLGTTTVYVTHDQVEAMTLGQRVAVLRAGRLHQVGPPDELYDRPADLFVAGFLGSPSMNLVRVQVDESEEGPRVRVAERTLTVPADSPAGRLLREAGEQVAYAGLRPEAFGWPESHEGAPRLEAAVAAVEVLGHEQILHLESDAPFVDLDALDREGPEQAETGDGRWVARLPTGRRVAVEDEVELSIDTSTMLWFDEDGQALPLPAED